MYDFITARYFKILFTELFDNLLGVFLKSHKLMISFFTKQIKYAYMQVKNF